MRLWLDHTTLCNAGACKLKHRTVCRLSRVERKQASTNGMKPFDFYSTQMSNVPGFFSHSPIVAHPAQLGSSSVAFTKKIIALKARNASRHIVKQRKWQPRHHDRWSRRESVKYYDSPNHENFSTSPCWVFMSSVNIQKDHILSRLGLVLQQRPSCRESRQEFIDWLWSHDGFWTKWPRWKIVYFDLVLELVEILVSCVIEVRSLLDDCNVYSTLFGEYHYSFLYQWLLPNWYSGVHRSDACLGEPRTNFHSHNACNKSVMRSPMFCTNEQSLASTIQ